MTSIRLTVATAGLMVVQAVTGLLLHDRYRDVEWIKATWLGNDGITLIVAAPLLAGGLVFATRGTPWGLLLWLGMLGYAIYNYAFYLFGAALNAFFPIYVTALLSSSLALFLALSRLDVSSLAAHFRPTTPVRLIGGYLTLVGVSLASVWFAIWAAYVFAGRATPVEPEAFKLVAALDSVLMVPALVFGGLLLWKRQAWGYVVAAIAGVQGSLYLLVLWVNSAVAVWRGLAAAPGEAPLWGTLTVLTSAATVVLLASARSPGASCLDPVAPTLLPREH
jgi:hypothetical protein